MIGRSPASPEVRTLLEDEQRRKLAAASRSARRRRRAWRLPLLILIIGGLAGLAMHALVVAMGGIG